MKPTLRHRRNTGRNIGRGFTLVEVLVALFAMALLSGMAWQGLEAVLKGRDASKASVDRAGRLATVLTQWEQDLKSVVDTGAVPGLQFDGQALRLTRRGDDGVHIVAWAVREGRWQRWSSPAYTQGTALQQGWLFALQLLGTEQTQLTLADNVRGWQVYFFYDGNWANAQSSSGAPDGNPPGNPSASPPSNPSGNPPAPPPAGALPAAVRIVVTLGEQTLTRDIALGPAGS